MKLLLMIIVTRKKGDCMLVNVNLQAREESLALIKNYHSFNSAEFNRQVLTFPDAFNVFVVNM